MFAILVKSFKQPAISLKTIAERVGHEGKLNESRLPAPFSSSVRALLWIPVLSCGLIRFLSGLDYLLPSSLTVQNLATKTL